MNESSFIRCPGVGFTKSEYEVKTNSFRIVKDENNNDIFRIVIHGFTTRQTEGWSGGEAKTQAQQDQTKTKGAL